MIRTHDDLDHYMKQLGHAMAALISMHKRIGHNPRNYALYSEGAVDMILELRAEIDEFLGIKPPTEPATGDNGAATRDTTPPSDPALAPAGTSRPQAD